MSSRLQSPFLAALIVCAFAGGAYAQTTAQPTSAIDQAIVTEEIGNEFIASGMLGGTFGDELDDGGMDFGASLAYLWNGTIGAEFLAGFAPDVALNATGPFDDNSVDSYMANAIVAVPFTGGAAAEDRLFQPYLSGGLGAMSLRVEETDELFGEPDETQLGMNAGGGLMAFWRRWGLRGDIRYFNGLDDDNDADADGLLDPSNALSDFSFWRTNVGVSYRW